MRCRQDEDVGRLFCCPALLNQESQMSKVSIEWQPGNPNDRSTKGFRIRNGTSKGPMSRAFYYKLKRRGDGPRETYLSPGRVIITAKDEAAWLEARANPCGTEARLLAKAAEMRRARAQKAGRAAVASPLHRSKRWAREAGTATTSTENSSAQN